MKLLQSQSKKRHISQLEPLNLGGFCLINKPKTIRRIKQTPAMLFSLIAAAGLKLRVTQTAVNTEAN